MPSSCGTKKYKAGKMVKTTKKPAKSAKGTKIRGTGAATKGTYARGPMA